MENYNLWDLIEHHTDTDLQSAQHIKELADLCKSVTIRTEEKIDFEIDLPEGTYSYQGANGKEKSGTHNLVYSWEDFSTVMELTLPGNHLVVKYLPINGRVQRTNEGVVKVDTSKLLHLKVVGKFNGEKYSLFITYNHLRGRDVRSHC